MSNVESIITEMRASRDELIMQGVHLYDASMRVVNATGEMQKIKANEGLKFQSELYIAAENAYKDACVAVTQL